MSTILVLEPSSDVRDLYRWTLEHLGHAVSFEVGAPGNLAAVILEPADASLVELVQALVAASPSLPVICASITPRHEISGIEPMAFLVKPFSLSQFEAVVRRALPTPV